MLFKRNSLLQLRAAITAQWGLANNKILTIWSSELLNTTFAEGESSFNFHLHSTQPLESNLSYKQNMPGDEQWAVALDYVRRKEISILIINGTLSRPVTKLEEITAKSPLTFLGKLLAILWEKYMSFNGAPESGMTILLTGDLEGSANRLEDYVLEIAHFNKINPDFLDWIEDSNLFCGVHTEEIVDATGPTDKYFSVLLPGKMPSAN